MYQKMTEDLIEFIRKGKSTYHVTTEMRNLLESSGVELLEETESWHLERGKKYMIERDGSALIAFSVPRTRPQAVRIAAAHTDSPAFKVKWNPEVGVEDKYIKLNVEKYGGGILSSWFDRPLSLAGRVSVMESEEIRTVLVDIDRDLLVIPNLAIHMNRRINDGYGYNVQNDLLPMFGNYEAKDSFMNLIAEASGVCCENILGMDLTLYNRMIGTYTGVNGEFILSPRLDDLQCLYAGIRGFIESDSDSSMGFFCAFDSEEIGSTGTQGASSTFLTDIAERIRCVLGMSEEEFYVVAARGFFLSADNAHAIHPNAVEKADLTNRPVLNGGIVIKYSADGSYVTNGVTGAKVKALCKRVGIPYQEFYNRSDMRGGSTLGQLSLAKWSIPAADIGLAQLAMHSSCETGGTKDTYYMYQLMKTFFHT